MDVIGRITDPSTGCIRYMKPNLEAHQAYLKETADAGERELAQRRLNNEYLNVQREIAVAEREANAHIRSLREKLDGMRTRIDTLEEQTAEAIATAQEERRDE